MAVTDDRWFEFLAARPHLTEANFWIPSAPKTYGLKPGAPMLFKTHHPHNRLVGGGWLSDYRRLPVSVAWDAFGEANGVASRAELLAVITAYRVRQGNPVAASEDPVIGCAMLRDTAYFAEHEQLAPPADFAKNIVRDKGYDADGDAVDPQVAAALLLLATRSPAGPVAQDLVWHRDGPLYGTPRLMAPRLGQDAFKAVVSAAYGMRCAITDDKVLPVLQAAHIRPVKHAGEHRVDNGLLLRADVHILFDQGYLGVHPERGELQVSNRLRDVYDNGREFYERKGQPIARPEGRRDRPNSEFLTWHMDEVFQP